MSVPSSRPPQPIELLDDIDTAAKSARMPPGSLRSPGENDSNAKPPRSIPRFLTVDELADLLRVNRKTVYEAIARGKIPGARRVGGAYRIFRDAVLGWFAGQSGVSRSRRKP